MLEEARINGRLINYFAKDNDQDGYGPNMPKEDELNKILEDMQRHLRPDRRLEKAPTQAQQEKQPEARVEEQPEAPEAP